LFKPCQYRQRPMAPNVNVNICVEQETRIHS
jgi:hypothetical protein